MFQLNHKSEAVQKPFRHCWFDIKLEKFAIQHPYLVFWLAFAGIPAAVLLTVGIATAVLSQSLTWLMGR